MANQTPPLPWKPRNLEASKEKIKKVKVVKKVTKKISKNSSVSKPVLVKKIKTPKKKLTPTKQTLAVEVLPPLPAVTAPPELVDLYDSANKTFVQNEEVSETAIVYPTNTQTKRMAMWAGVSVSMFLIVFGWAWSLKNSIFESVFPSVEKEQTVVDEPIGTVKDQFSDLFVEVGKEINELKTPLVDQNKTLEQVDTSVKTLSPEKIEALKQKVIDTATNTETTKLPNQ